MFYKHDTTIRTLLLNIHEHLKRDWDFLLVICGDTGTGKSRFALQLIDSWYRFILKQEPTKETAKFIASDYRMWLENFKTMEEYQINVYDEGATSLDSKDFMTKLSKDLTKLFNVFRAKKFFSVIIIPSFFDLNKYFREKRVRGLIWVNKRGHYSFYSKTGIQYLNAYNERALVKSMYRAKPFHNSTFPDYDGVMLKPYEACKSKTMDSLIAEVIESVTEKKKSSVADIMFNEVKRLRAEGMEWKKIRKELNIGGTTISKIRIMLQEEKFKET